MRTVYLCGPITGRSEEEVYGWRTIARRALQGNANVFDPAALPIDRSHHGSYDATSERRRVAHAALAVERDREAVRTADLVFACFRGMGDLVSVGSVGEIFWANAFGTPVVVVRDPGTVYDHGMLTAMAAAAFTSLDEALAHCLERLRQDRRP
jgi:hypothetical protein